MAIAFISFVAFDTLHVVIALTSFCIIKVANFVTVLVLYQSLTQFPYINFSSLGPLLEIGHVDAMLTFPFLLLCVPCSTFLHQRNSSSPVEDGQYWQIDLKESSFLNRIALTKVH